MSENVQTTARLASLRRAAPEPENEKLSDVLKRLANRPGEGAIAISDLLYAMRDRAIAALLFVFALPIALPMPPGASAILGLPLIFLALQLALGKQPWLPKFITKQSMPKTSFKVMVDKIVPWQMRAERLLKPRLSFLATATFERVAGWVCLLMAVILFLPIPLGNMLPAFTICVFALGLLEKDGVWIITGFVSAIAACVLVSGVVAASVAAIVFLAQQALGLL